LKDFVLQRAVSAAMKLAIDLEVESEFQSVKRIRYVKRHLDYEAHVEPITTPEKKL
jgi:ribosomal protein S17